MNTKKCGMIVAIGAAIGLLVCSTSAYAAQTEDVLTSGDYSYELLDNGTASLVGYNGSDTQISIPNELNGVIVSEIEEEAFSGNNKLESVALGSEIKYLKSGAFSGCTNLKSVKVNEELIDIGDECFKDCESLTEFYIPSKTAFLGKDAFLNCTKMSEIELPNTLMQIGDHAVGFKKDKSSGEYVKIENFKIRCVVGSLGSKYAYEYEIEYVEGELRSSPQTTASAVTKAESAVELSESESASQEYSKSESSIKESAESDNGYVVYILVGAFIVAAFTVAGVIYSKSK